jgi:HemY protein
VIRLAWFILKFVAVIALAVWLADEPGKLTLTWHGYAIETSAAALCFVIVLLVAACLLAYKLVRLLRYGPKGMKVRRALNNQQLGLRRLEQGFTALAAGDAAEAGKMALAARKLIGTTALTHWLQAQAAQLAGDHASADTIFQQLAKEKPTAVLGYRGLIGGALRQNNPAQAAALVEELSAVQPKTPWLQVARYEVASRQGAWAQAAQALKRANSQHLLEIGDVPQREAALLLAEARTALKAGEQPRALQAAEQAQSAAPDWLPARIELVRTLLAGGYAKPALKRIEKFWDSTPHPALGALYGEALGAEAPLKRFKHIEQLCRNTLQHPASLILLAEAALAAGLWGEAERHLQRAATLAPTRQVYRLQAELAEKDNQPPNKLREALRRAAEAPAEACWRCAHCGHSPAQWEINCVSCGTPMSVNWFDGSAAAKPAVAVAGKQ